MKRVPEHVRKLEERAARLLAERNRLGALVDATNDAWFSARMDVIKACSHRYEDGSSAMESGYAYDVCQICGYTD